VRKQEGRRPKQEAESQLNESVVGRSSRFSLQGSARFETDLDIPQVLHNVNSAADAVLQSCLSSTDLLSSSDNRFFETNMQEWKSAAWSRGHCKIDLKNLRPIICTLE
jgi:hypothetical protein